jgi:hypothetical protein
VKPTPILLHLLSILLVGPCFAQQAEQPPSAPQPRVFLQASSHGNVWNARRDQAMEMAKDFQKNCPDVKVTILQSAADYTVILNHVEVGAFGRDNQFQIANKDGDMLGGVREKNGIKSGSINGGVKAACNTILADWNAKQAPAANAAPAADAAPASSEAAAPAAPTQVAYPQGSAQVQTATQTTPGDPVSQDNSVAGAAKKAQQYKACLALAKDNPSIVCNQ